MTESDISIISKKIDQEKEYLGDISHQLWENPELAFQEISAHALLTDSLEKYGFEVKRHYFLPTAFRAEFSTSKSNGPTIAVMCEYDALPQIGHACGHNLIAEAGIAVGIAVKAAMEADPSIQGKIVVLGTPAEETGGGKIKLIEHGAFNDIDGALMAHPAQVGSVFMNIICSLKISVTYKGKEAHASAFPWEGKNALDAAVSCYTNIALLRQQMKPTCIINGIISSGGVAPNIIPGETQMIFILRAPSEPELKSLTERAVACFKSAAAATGCDIALNFGATYLNMIDNSIMANIFTENVKLFGLKFVDNLPAVSASTDMGNVSHVVPSIQPIYGIGGSCKNHTKGFTDQAGTAEAQVSTLAAANAMAVTVVKLMRSPELIRSMKDTFGNDLTQEKEAF